MITIFTVFTSKSAIRGLLLSYLFLSMGMMAQAQDQQVTVPVGSPSAMKSLDSTILPEPPSKFGEEINLNAYQSKPWWPPQITPPQGAPNILLIMTDDVGFGAPSTFGGTIPTPALDRIAKMGLRYTQFHSTALCSPTRAALITGRNHHSVHFGMIAELSTGYPGYDTIIGKDTATIGEILKQNGYGTSWFGKNHTTPVFQESQVGPFDRWPTGLGFEYFYGFNGGDTSQWEPNLFRNTSPIYPYVGKPGWNLITAMADEAINWMKQINEIAPEKPFFVYYVPGGTHSPHHPTPEWIEKFKGHFDAGWNVEREKIFANQKRLGVIPQSAQLTPWPDDLLPRWDTLPDNQKKLYARQAEVYAAYLAYTDYEIGRVIQAVEDMGKLDNTLIIYISGDNGASPEGTMTGTPNEMASFNGVNISVEEQLKDFYEIWGSSMTYPHMAVPWSWAFGTPFKWTKQIASHFGGTRQGMAIAWPKVIKDAGGIRNQFHHVIDIMPTILEATGIKEPNMVNGVPQKPIEGVSLMYTFDKQNANAPSKHHTQYFEMFGNRALYHEGWVANTTPIKPPWDITKEADKDAAHKFKWELYDLTKDWTQFNDISATYPEKLLELQEMFLVEAAKHNVLPFDTSAAQRTNIPRPSHIGGKTKFTYSGKISGIPNNDAPNILNHSFIISADIEIPQEGAEGMLVTDGGRFGGYGFYLLKGKPVFLYNFVDVERTRWEGTEALSPGKHTLVFDFEYDGGGLGKGGLGVLKVDGKEVANHRIERTIPFTIQWNETFDVGVDTGTPVDDKDYQVPFKFTGQLINLTLTLKPVPLKAEDQKAADIKGQKNNKASE